MCGGGLVVACVYVGSMCVGVCVCGGVVVACVMWVVCVWECVCVGAQARKMCI